MLDVGCGVATTAIQIARRYGHRGGHLTADAGARRGQYPGRGVADLVTVTSADILALPFDDAAFDVIIAAAVTMFTDRPKAAAELARGDRPGGRVLATEFYWRTPPTPEARGGPPPEAGRDHPKRAGRRPRQRHDPGSPAQGGDIFRHLGDLRSGTYKGARQWPDRVEVFRRAVSLLDPVVRRILEQANAVFLRGTGTIHHRSGEDRAGGAYAHWELSWPEQRHAAGRHGGRVEPVQVIAVFGRGSTHPHLRGAVAGMWPCQVTGAADAERQEPILRAIVECELHERIFQGTWQVIPAFTSQDADAAT